MDKIEIEDEERLETPADEEVTEENEVPEEEQVVQEEDNSPEAQLAKAQTEIADLKDKYLRQAAEFDNYRKRVATEKGELVKNGGARVMTSILPILDDFERAH